MRPRHPLQGNAGEPRRARSRVGLLCAALVLGMTPTVGSLAGPTGGPLAGAASASPAGNLPSAGDVARAKQAVSGKAVQVAALEKRLDAAEARAQKAETDLSIAAENYLAAKVELDRLTSAADLAGAAASEATAAFGAARTTVGRIAAQQYRDGGSLGPAAAVLGSGGPQEVLDRASFYEVVGTDQNRAVRQLASSRGVREGLQAQARAARADQAAAARRLEAARRIAEAKAATARAVLAETQRQQASLLQQLAALRATSVALEKQRRDGLERLRQERLRQAREKAERARLARETAAREKSAREKPAREQPAREKPAGGKQTRQDGAGDGEPSGGGSPSSAGRTALRWARSQLGKPYEWAADGPGSYDCSGLTMRAWQRAGVGLVHSSRYQYGQSSKISYSSLRPGDLIFWAYDTGNPETIHHVALYAGGGMILEAPFTGASVRLSPMRWDGAMPYAGRP